MTAKYEKLKTLLKELLQLDQPDLDFGLYRIMHAKSAEVTQFLERDLLPQVRQALAAHESAEVAEARQALAERVELRQRLGDDPEQDDEVQRLRQKVTHAGAPAEQLEAEIYDHLYGFFRRYYSEGDFLSKRVYKPGVYAIPYEGEEVKLHWANADQYYIKTSEYLRDYAFRLRPDDDDPMRVHFQLVDATEGEHGNVKPAAGKDRVFVLAARDFLAMQPGEQAEELVIRFEYRPATLADWPEDTREGKTKPPTQKELTEIAERRIGDRGQGTGDSTTPGGTAAPGCASPMPTASAHQPSAAAPHFSEGALARWLAELSKPHVKSDGERADYSRLRAHLNRYVARNTFDYFIHKDLGKFLRRELDFYIKNEVLHLDDIESQTAPRVEQYLSKIKIIRRIAGKIIDFVAQLEDFQKTVWLKAKFVTGTDYCIALKCIPKEFYPEIFANSRQLTEWADLYALEANGRDANGNGRLFADDSGVSALSRHFDAPASLMIDTRHFQSDFTARLLNSLDGIDAKTDGILIHSENFQALRLIQARYHARIDYAYLDPPFNTSDTGFLYKNEYRHSSWLSMIAQVHGPLSALLGESGLESIAIDDEELFNLASALDSAAKHGRRIGTLVVEIKPSGRTNDSFLSTSHEYYLWYAKDPEMATISFFELDEQASSAYSYADESGDYKWRDFLRTGGYSTPEERPNSYYPIFYRPADGSIALEPIPNSVEILPLDSVGSKRVWRKTPPSFLEHLHAGDIRVEQTRNDQWKVRIKDRIKEGTRPKSVWVGSKYDASSHGTKLLKALFGDSSFFSFPKSVHAVFDAVWIATKGHEDAVICDIFTGSGTTGHAVIKLNREDGGRRRFILVEMADYFESVLLPRLKKVALTSDWKEGKPGRFPTPEEAERGPRIFKVIRLESYEDALNNLAEPRRTEAQQRLLDSPEAQGANSIKEQYMLRYLLDVETRGSQSLLNVRAFVDPTAYRLRVKRPGSDESREVNVDLLETFNWLIGLTVRHIAAPRTFRADFERDGEGRLKIKGRLKEVDLRSDADPADATFAERKATMEGSPHPNPLPEGPDGEGVWWFRTVTGTTPEGKKTLVIWRKRPGGDAPEGVERDNLVLDEWFTRQGYSSKDSEFELIYVNGGNNLENLKTPDDAWKVRVIEDDFHRLMFATEEG